MDYKFSILKRCLAISIILTTALIHAQLSVTILPTKFMGQKAIVPLHLTNSFTNSIQSARAVCFLQDASGKMVGESTRWVVGEKKSILKPKQECTFNIVVTTRQAIAPTNLTAKITFTQVVMIDGTVLDPKQVNIVNAPN